MFEADEVDKRQLLQAQTIINCQRLRKVIPRDVHGSVIPDPQLRIEDCGPEAHELIRLERMRGETLAFGDEQ